jgi:large subunit ribosomal protein L28
LHVSSQRARLVIRWKTSAASQKSDGATTMAMCELCGKKPMFGHNVSHSNRKTNRKFKPNVQRVTVILNGVPKRMRICTRCLRTLYKEAREA